MLEPPRTSATWARNLTDLAMVFMGMMIESPGALRQSVAWQCSRSILVMLHNLPQRLNPIARTEEFDMPNRVAEFDTTHGTFKVELFEERAPTTTKNFIDLIEKEYYDGVVFHRVIADFMLQGGDPEGTGRGGPGYMIPDEFHPELTHASEGVLSMANAGPNTGGAQFFITLTATPWLDGKHAVFGKVIEGLEIIRQIGALATGPGDRPLEEVVMTTVRVAEVAEEPDASEATEASDGTEAAEE